MSFSEGYEKRVKGCGIKNLKVVYSKETPIKPLPMPEQDNVNEQVEVNKVTIKRGQYLEVYPLYHQ